MSDGLEVDAAKVAKAATAATAYQFSVLTLFPEMIRQAASHSIVARGVAAGRLDIQVTDIRDFTTDRHRTADDVPYGGGPGMVMKPEPLAAAIADARSRQPKACTVLMSASGRPFDQATARRYADLAGGLILICGHYEGVDERIALHFIDEEISIGDYVLSGGELAALVVLDAVSRLVPGVVGNQASLADESHESGLLEYPQFTRPQVFMGHAVPDVLLSGNHADVARYRRDAALAKTRRLRPDLAARVVEVVVERRKGVATERQAHLGRPRSEAPE